MKQLKPVLVIVTIFLLIICILGIVRFVHEIDRQNEEKEQFSLCQKEFEIINEYILQTSSGKSEVSFQFESSAGKITTLTMIADTALSEENTLMEIPLEKEHQEAFAKIIPRFNSMDFSFIDVTTERISYGGLGGRMYVYSRNGEKPSYFYSKEGRDVSWYSTFHLGGNWYLLTNHAR